MRFHDFLHACELCDAALPAGREFQNIRVEFSNGSQPAYSDCFEFGRCLSGRAAPGSASALSGRPDCCAPSTSLTRIDNRNGPLAGSSDYSTASRSALACGVRCCLACGQDSTLTCRVMSPLTSGWSTQTRTSHLPNATNTHGAHNDDSRTNQQHEITP